MLFTLPHSHLKLVAEGAVLSNARSRPPYPGFLQGSAAMENEGRVEMAAFVAVSGLLGKSATQRFSLKCASK
jgi:hypothetical protein